MAGRSQQPGSDVPARTAAIAERRRSVLVDAGAGTGKTSLVVERFVDMVAPVGGAAPVPIERLAAITFPGKAAGDLRLRIRERLLAALAQPELAAERSSHLRAALARLDTAYVGRTRGCAHQPT